MKLFDGQKRNHAMPPSHIIHAHTLKYNTYAYI